MTPDCIPSLLLQDPHAEEFEDKEWTFVIENVSMASLAFKYYYAAL